LDRIDPRPGDVDRGGSRPKEELGPLDAGGLVVALGDFPVPAPWVVKAPGPRRFEAGHRRQDFSEELAQGTRPDAPPRLNRREVLRVEPPDLAGVREVELTTDGIPQAPLQQRGKGLLGPGFRGPGPDLAEEIEGGPESEAGRQRAQEVQRPEREMDPA